MISAKDTKGVGMDHEIVVEARWDAYNRHFYVVRISEAWSGLEDEAIYTFHIPIGGYVGESYPPVPMPERETAEPEMVLLSCS